MPINEPPLEGSPPIGRLCSGYLASKMDGQKRMVFTHQQESKEHESLP